MKRRSRGAEGLDTTDLQLASKKRVVTYIQYFPKVAKRLWQRMEHYFMVRLWSAINKWEKGGGEDEVHSLYKDSAVHWR